MVCPASWEYILSHRTALSLTARNSADPGTPFPWAIHRSESLFTFMEAKRARVPQRFDLRASKPPWLCNPPRESVSARVRLYKRKRVRTRRPPPLEVCQQHADFSREKSLYWGTMNVSIPPMEDFLVIASSRPLRKDARGFHSRSLRSHAFPCERLRHQSITRTARSPLGAFAPGRKPRAVGGPPVTKLPIGAPAARADFRPTVHPVCPHNISSGIVSPLISSAPTTISHCLPLEPTLVTRRQHPV